MASNSARLHIRRTVPTNESGQKTISVYQSRYATIKSTSQISARAVGLTIDALRSEPGFDTPQTRQYLASGLTSAPQPLQSKIKDRPRRRLFHARTPLAADSVQVFDRIPVSVHKAINRVIASRAEKHLPLVTKMVPGMRTASG
jgi:hypothetical protein